MSAGTDVEVGSGCSKQLTTTITYGCGHKIIINDGLGDAIVASCLTTMCDECCYRAFVKDPDGLLFYASRAVRINDWDHIAMVTARRFFNTPWVDSMLIRVLDNHPDISKMYITRCLDRSGLGKDEVQLTDPEKLCVATKAALNKYPELAKEWSECSTESISSEAFSVWLSSYPEEAVKYLSDTSFKGKKAKEIIKGT